MLTEIRIDNYKCMSNFSIEPKGFQLWLGDNGTGKTTVFDVLRGLQDLMQGRHVDDIFRSSTLTAWDARETQLVSVAIRSGGDHYTYELILEHNRNLRKVRIGREELKWNGATFFLFEDTEARLFRIGRESNQVEFETSFAADWSRSLIHAVAEREDNWPLLRFRDIVRNWLIVSPIPVLFRGVSDSESRQLSRHCENFADWYRYMIQERPSIAGEAKRQLEAVLPGLEEISLREAGQARKLVVTFRNEGREVTWDFSELSDGQRQLIALYYMLEALRAGLFSGLFIDEPDNFISLREIQPWILNLQDVCETHDRQAIIVSHHPEVINRMALGEELWFAKHRTGHAVAGPMKTNAELPPAEVVARGWDGE